MSNTVKSREAVTLHPLLPGLIRLSTSVVRFYVQCVIGVLNQILQSAQLFIAQFIAQFCLTIRT